MRLYEEKYLTRLLLFRRTHVTDVSVAGSVNCLAVSSKSALCSSSSSSSVSNDCASSLILAEWRIHGYVVVLAID